MSNAFDFPPDFVWGTATSAYQIEGATDVNGRGESIWDRFCTVPGAIADGSDGRIACDHYHRYREDVDLIATLGFNAYRFSIAWPRVIPNGTGPVNAKGLDFYDRLVDALLEKDIAPYATLYHWDLPQTLEDQGGWRNRDTAHAFADYTHATVARLGDRVTSWATLNEPYCAAVLGHQTGEHAPGMRFLKATFAAAHHLLLAHGLAIPVIRDQAPQADAGIVLNFTPAYPASDSDADKKATAIKDGFDNRWYVEPIAGTGYPEDTVNAMGWDQAEIQPDDLNAIAAPVDFLGVNYYTRQVISAEGPVEPTLPVTDMGWEIHPDGLYDTLRTLHTHRRFTKLYITENGAAMPDTADDTDRVDDQDRIDYLERHLESLLRARRDGVPVEGYFGWSLLDNFEWALGYAKRFGLVRVNFDTLARTPKASALWLRDAVRAGRASR
ncbi:MAG: GH1 family beta-glucosidase [Pseudomonadota bacterium]